MANKFKTVYNPPEKIVSVSGEKDRPNYKPKYIEGGSYELVEDGMVHSYDDIQAWLPECDMTKVIELYKQTGDEKLLQRRAGFYDPDGALPSDYVELHNQLKNADLVFEGLPTEIKQKYGNSPAKFFSSPNNMEVIRNYYEEKETRTNVANVPISENNNKEVGENNE